MKRLNNSFCIALLCTAVACNDASTGSDAAKTDTTATTTTTTVADETPMMKDSAVMMKAMMDYGTPGEQHANLAKENGTWNVDMTYWMTPDAPPQKMTGVATNKMIWGGRFQQSTFKSEMAPGMPFEGVSTLGYDNAKKVFVNTWVDNMSTGMMYMEGKYDDASKTVNYTGKGTDMRSGKDITMRQTVKIVDENTMQMEMYCTYPGGKEYKSMEMLYKRKK